MNRSASVSNQRARGPLPVLFVAALGFASACDQAASTATEDASHVDVVDGGVDHVPRDASALPTDAGLSPASDAESPTPPARPDAALPDAAPPTPSRDGAADPTDASPQDAAAELVELDGVCGRRGEATANAETFEGFEELFIISDEGFGVDVCVVQVAVNRIADAPDGCVDFDGEPCEWSHLVQYSEPSILVDEGGACANSELGLDAAGLDELDGLTAAYGYVSEYVGHNSVVLRFDESSQSWVPNGNATWDEDASVFSFNRRDGICSYQGIAP